MHVIRNEYHRYVHIMDNKNVRNSSSVIRAAAPRPASGWLAAVSSKGVEANQVGQDTGGKTPTDEGAGVAPMPTDEGTGTAPI